MKTKASDLITKEVQYFLNKDMDHTFPGVIMISLAILILFSLPWLAGL